MKKIAVFLGSAAISISGSALWAQQAEAGVKTDTTVNAGVGSSDAHLSQSASVNATASADRNGATTAADSQTAAQLRTHSVNGELVGKLDSKTAKTGDKVVLKTDEAFRTSEGVLVPKGSRLVGHVTEVQAHGNGHQDSRLGIQFDRAELKSGQEIRMQSMIETVAPPANAMAAASMDSGEDVGMAGGGGRTMGGGHAGAGLLGGGASAVTSTTAGAGSGLNRTAGGSIDTASALTSSTGVAPGNSLNGAANATGELAARATSVPGVMLQADAAGSASGVLSASKRNVHLDSGTQMTVGVAGAVGR